MTTKRTVITEKENSHLLLGSVIKQHFEIHPQCRGTPLFTKPLKLLFEQWGAKTPKNYFVIDFILRPKASILSSGWELGCIGVEAKYSSLEGNRFGRAVCQIFDYQLSTFKIKNEGECALSMIFLLENGNFHKTEASILMQEGIGLIRINKYNGEVRFLHGNGMHPILTINGEEVSYRRPRFGKRTGHR